MSGVFSHRFVSSLAESSVLQLQRDVSERGDGGGRVRSPDVPGLLATGKDAAVLWRQLPDMIRSLLRSNRGLEVGELDLGTPPTVRLGETRRLVVTAERSPA